MKTQIRKQVKTEVKKNVELKLPIAKYKSGALQTAVWSNEVEKDGEKFEIFSFTIERNYKKDEEWKKTNTFRKQDIAGLQAMINKVSELLLIDEDEEKDIEDIE